MNASILTCRACRAPLSVPLTEIAVHADPVCLDDGRDVVPRGCLWVAPTGFSELVAVRGGDLMCCRQDLPEAVSRGDVGCCGPSGMDGPNLLCRCGAALGTEMGDCWQSHVVGLDPRRVDRVPAEAIVLLHVFRGDPARPSAWEFASWLHQALAAEDWYGVELPGLVSEWAARAAAPVVIIWVDADRDEAAGVPVGATAAALGAHGIRVVRSRAVPNGLAD